jgi:hypothetical protein
METLTDSEKEDLAQLLEDYVCHLHEYGHNEASIKYYSDLRDKLDLILFPQLSEYE